VYSLQTHSDGASSSKTNCNYTGKSRNCIGHYHRTLGRRDRFATDYRGGKPLHFFELRAELEENKVHTGFFALVKAFGDLLSGADKAGAEARLETE
jgi:hypothetical protein